MSSNNIIFLKILKVTITNKMKNILIILLSTTIIVSCQNQTQKSEKELKSEISESIVLKNFDFISNGDMDSFQKTISNDFKFILSTLKGNDSNEERGAFITSKFLSLLIELSLLDKIVGLVLIIITLELSY